MFYNLELESTVFSLISAYAHISAVILYGSLTLFEIPNSYQSSYVQ